MAEQKLERLSSDIAFRLMESVTLVLRDDELTAFYRRAYALVKAALSSVADPSATIQPQPACWSVAASLAG